MSLPLVHQCPESCLQVGVKVPTIFPVLLVTSQMAVSLLRLLFGGKLLPSPSCSPTLFSVGVSGGQRCWVTFVSEYVVISLYVSFPYFYEKGLWDGLRAATLSGVPNCLNYCVILVIDQLNAQILVL